MVLLPAPDLSQLEAGIAASLEDAGRTLLSMPTAGAVPVSLRRVMPHGFIEAAIEAHGSIAPCNRPPAPSPRRVAEMAEAFGWVAMVTEERIRRLLLLRSLVHPVTGRPFFGARRTSRLFGVHTSTIEAWHARGLHMIALQLHHQAAIEEPVDQAAFPKDGRWPAAAAGVPELPGRAGSTVSPLTTSIASGT